MYPAMAYSLFSSQMIQVDEKNLVSAFFSITCPVPKIEQTGKKAIFACLF